MIDWSLGDIFHFGFAVSSLWVCKRSSVSHIVFNTFLAICFTLYFALFIGLVEY